MFAWSLTLPQIRRLGNCARVIVVATFADILTIAQRQTVQAILQRDLSASELAIDTDEDVDDSDSASDADSGHEFPPPPPLLVFAPERGFKRTYPTHEIDCLDARISDFGRLYGSIVMEQEIVRVPDPIVFSSRSHIMSQLRSASWENYYEKFRTDRLMSRQKTTTLR